MIKWVDHLTDLFDRLPGWARLLLFPVVAPLLLAYSAVLIPFVLPYFLVFGNKGESPAAKFSLGEVRAHAASLDRWFKETRAKHPDSADTLGVGPELAQELARLAGQPGLTREEARQFAERVRISLKGYKGSPFFGLYELSQRLVELADNERAA
jgi:hypothetical protein